MVGLRLPHLRGPHTFLSSLSFLPIWEISTMYWSLRVRRYIKTHKNLAKHIDKSNRKLTRQSSIWNLALVWMCTLLVHVLGVVVWETFPGETQYKKKKQRQQKPLDEFLMHYMLITFFPLPNLIRALPDLPTQPTSYSFSFSSKSVASFLKLEGFVPASPLSGLIIVWLCLFAILEEVFRGVKQRL